MYSERILPKTIFRKILSLFIVSIFFSNTVHATTIGTRFWENGTTTIYETNNNIETEEENKSLSDSENEEDLYFIITGYYSPLPWQEDYITGTYEGDIRLNGSWVNGASGKAVFEWMLAAPKKYDFGTKIYLENFGVWSVQDRGGAIVEAWVRGHEHDRIDIWMGYGDQGRKRAINWGKRTVKAKIVDREEEVSLKLKTSLEDRYLSLYIRPESESIEIRKFQEFFREIGKYDGEITWNYEDIQQSLLDYQYEKNIIKDDNDWWAGYFWPKTIAEVKKDLWVALRKEDFIPYKERKKIEKIKELLLESIEKKEYDTMKEKRMILNLKNRILKFEEKIKDRRLKAKISYLRSII